METTDNVKNNSSVSQIASLVSNSVASTSKSSSTVDLGDFGKLLQSILVPDQSNQVSEEELFASVVQERLKTLKGDDVTKKYADELAKQKAALKKPDGFIPYEDAAKNALKALRADKTLTSEEADKVYSQSFAASQLDSNTEVLWDNRGGGADITIAVDTMTSAMEKAKAKIDAFDSSKEAATQRSLDETTSTSKGTGKASGTLPADLTKAVGTKIDGPGGFLFKPVSNNEGKLAVILPSAFKGLVSTLTLTDESGKVIDTGRSTGFGDAGVAEKFVFSKPGQSYPSNITVEITLLDGTSKSYEIKDPSKRYD